ncbi:MAG: Lrp/AsnC family transcriptional regulator, partial [Candidatus Kariarchaeaceae archaeon]
LIYLLNFSRTSRNSFIRSMSVEFDMATAFILINTDVAAEEEVMEQLKSIAEVKSVHLVYGIYDLIVQIEADDLDTLKKGVTENLRSIEKIRSTMTMIAVE